MTERDFFTPSNGKTLCFAHYGKQDGIPLFFFHGWPSSRLQGRMVHESALRLGIHIVAPDRPGLGQSEYDSSRRLIDWPEVVHELADHLSWDRFAVMGISGGGPYALACAADSSERVTRAEIVCGAVPLGCFDDHSELMWPYRALLALRPRLPWLLPSILKSSSIISRCPLNRPPMSWALQWTSKSDREALLSPNASAITESFREAMIGDKRGVVHDGDLYSADWEIDFSKISTPVQFWHGEEDRNIPHSLAKSYASWIPSATFRSFPSEGHYSISINTIPDVLASAIAPLRAVA